MTAIHPTSAPDNRQVVFVVDDNATNLSVLSKFLDQVGFSVRAAKSGDSALRKIAYEKPDLVLLDIMMPGMNGFETCKHLKADAETKDIPVIFMTALSDTEDKVKGLSMGAVDYITKPFLQDEVLARIRLQLNLRTLSKEIEQKNISLENEVQQRRTAESALQESLQELQKTQKQMIAQEKLASLGNLTAGIAHELRNPLNFVINFSESSKELLDDLKTEINTQATALEPTSLNEILELVQDVQENAIAIHQHGMRAEQIISSMMQHARSDADTLTPQPTRLNALVSESFEFAYHSFRAKEHKFNATIHQDYSDAVGELNLMPSSLSRAFINLLENAFYAVRDRQQMIETEGHRGDYDPQIWIKTAIADNEARVTIRDNGKGVPANVIDKIFQPFITTKPPGEGTGLGLSMSYEIIVGQHQGRLSVTSDSSSWSEFMVALPLSIND